MTRTNWRNGSKIDNTCNSIGGITMTRIIQTITTGAIVGLLTFGITTDAKAAPPASGQTQSNQGPHFFPLKAHEVKGFVVFAMNTFTTEAELKALASNMTATIKGSAKGKQPPGFDRTAENAGTTLGLVYNVTGLEPYNKDALTAWMAQFKVVKVDGVWPEKEADDLINPMRAEVDRRLTTVADSPQKTHALGLLKLADNAIEQDVRFALTQAALGVLDEAAWIDLFPAAGGYDDAKAALDAGETEFHGNTLPPTVNEQVIRDAMDKGLTVCVYSKNGPKQPHCGEPGNVTPEDFTVTGTNGVIETVRYDQIPNEKIVTVGKMGPDKTPFEQAKEAVETNTSLHGHDPLVAGKLDETGAKTLGLEGKEAVLYRPNQEPFRGTIQNIGADGFDINKKLDDGATATERVTYAELNNGEAYVMLGGKQDTNAKGGKIDNSGFHAGVGFAYHAVIAKKGEDGEREFTTAHVPGVNVYGGWTSDKIPLRARVGVQVSGLLKGAASHYTQLIKGGERVLVMPYGEIATVPRFGKNGRVGLEASLLFGGFVSGGWAVLAGLGPCGFFNWGDICGRAEIGHMNTGKAAGSNPTSNLPNPVVQGLAAGFNLNVSLYPGNWGKSKKK